MSIKINKNGKEYPVGVIPQNVIDDVTFLKGASNYSTTEHKVGKWIDGSTIYEKTIDCGALPNNAEKTVAHNISNLKYVVDIKGIAIRETNPIAYPMPFLALDNLSYGIQVNVGTTNVVITTKSNLSYMDKSYVTLRYIKA